VKENVRVRGVTGKIEEAVRNKVKTMRGAVDCMRGNRAFQDICGLRSAYIVIWSSK
jgi:hypothetical protein